MLDRKVFLGVMTVFCDVLSRPPLSEPSLDFYYESIKDMETAAFTRRATEIIRGRKYTSLPTPADFLNLPDDQDSGMLAAESVLRLMELIGGDSDLHGQDPAIMMTIDAMGGWPACCDTVREFDVDKLGIWKRDFASVYKATARMDQAKSPRVLFGRHSQSNITRGFLNPSTGELKNISGEVVGIKPWGSKQIATENRKAIGLGTVEQPVLLDAEELKNLLSGLAASLPDEEEKNVVDIAEQT